MKMVLWLSVTSLLLSSLMMELHCSAAQPLSKTTCYGYDFIIYRRDLGNPERLFFTSDVPGSQTIQVFEKYTSLDPHYQLSGPTFSVREVTDKDTGTFSAGDNSTALTPVLLLKVLECSSEAIKDYGSDHHYIVHGYEHILEFSPLESPEEHQVLWSRTGSPPPASEEGARGRMVNNQWMMEKLTHQHTGYYTFRGQNRKFEIRVKITVKEQYQHINDTAVGQDFHIRFGMDPALFDLTFTPSGGPPPPPEPLDPLTAPPSGGSPPPPLPLVLMKAGSLLVENTERLFAGRLQKTDDGRSRTLQITLNDLQLSDSGRYELRDQNGRLALVLDLEVQESNVRLVGGTSHCAGTLEMKHCAEWRPVGDPLRTWSTKSASVVCRQLGCGSAVSTTRSSGSLQPIWRIPYRFQSESSPRERGIDLSDTSSSRLEVICADTVRLVNGNSLCSGRVEVKSNQSWVPVCYADFDQQDAQVLCRELGCGATPIIQQALLYGEVKAPMWTKEFQCEGSESVLLDCRTSDSTRRTCSPDMIVGLDCYEPDDVRLVGGTSNCTGRLEMKHLGEWRPVDEALDPKSLSVLCRQMDCGNAVSSKRRDGSTRQPVWRIAPSCVKHEYSLRECGAKESADSSHTLEVICSSPHRQQRP